MPLIWKVCQGHVGICSDVGMLHRFRPQMALADLSVPLYVVLQFHAGIALPFFNRPIFDFFLTDSNKVSLLC